jgi:hypothetical protein
MCKAYKKGLACLTSVAISYKRNLKSQLLNINICGQQTISQLIIGNQLIFDCNNSSTKCKGYLVLKLFMIVFKTQIRLISQKQKAGLKLSKSFGATYTKSSELVLSFS